MNVLRHEYEGGKSITMALHCPVQALGQHLPPRVVGQQRPATVARERQLMDVARIMVMADSLLMSRRLLHATDLTTSRHCWTSQQWHPRLLHATDLTTSRHCWTSQQWHPARERRLMDAARIMVMADSLLMSRRLLHATDLTTSRHCWTSQQWHPRHRSYHVTALLDKPAVAPGAPILPRHGTAGQASSGTRPPHGMNSGPNTAFGGKARERAYIAWPSHLPEYLVAHCGRSSLTPAGLLARI